jgi:uncharacterized membrane protein YkoI
MNKTLIALVAAAGLAVGCKQSIEQTSQKFNELPRPVQTTVRATAPNAEIYSIDRKTENGMELYEITLQQGDQKPKMVVSADGRVVSSDLAKGGAGVVEKAVTSVTGTGSGTKFSALPAKVQMAIKAHAPETAIADISRHEDNGRVYYEVSFQDQGKNPTIKVNDDGTLMQDLQK